MATEIQKTHSDVSKVSAFFLYVNIPLLNETVGRSAGGRAVVGQSVGQAVERSGGRTAAWSDASCVNIMFKP